MKSKKQKSMMELLREIRDRISHDTMNMTFEQVQEYFELRKEKFSQKKRRKKYQVNNSISLAAESRTSYGK